MNHLKGNQTNTSCEHRLEQQTDIAIVGGGVGGCITALALASKYSVTLIDKNHEPPPRVGESLPATAKRIFQKLQLPALPGPGQLPAMGMASWWGSDKVQYSDQLRNPDGVGWHVDRQRLETYLRAQLKQRNVQCLWPYQLGASQNHNSGWRLSLNSRADVPAQPIILDARLVIDASGRHCTFARQQDVTRQQDDKLVSVWMTFQTQVQNQLAFICSVENGWWYCAPIPRAPDTDESEVQGSSTRILSFQTDADLLPKTFMDEDLLWQQACNLPQFAEVLEAAEKSSVKHYGKVAANSSILCDAQNNHWFAIGDAAMSFDPLSSQGMFNAMASGMQLADLIREKGIDSAASLDGIASEYQQQLQRIWHYYQHHKKLYYRQERRWQKSEFWRRRHCD